MEEDRAIGEICACTNHPGNGRGRRRQDEKDWDSRQVGCSFARALGGECHNRVAGPLTNASNTGSGVAPKYGAILGKGELRRDGVDVLLIEQWRNALFSARRSA